MFTKIKGGETEMKLEIGKHYVFERERIKYIGTANHILYDEEGLAIKRDFLIFVFRMDNGRIIEFDSLQAIREFNKEKDK